MEKLKLINLPGESIEPADLAIPKAQQFLVAVAESDFAQIIQLIRISDDKEAIVVQATIESPQYPVFDIRTREIFAVVFDKQDQTIPKVYMLREDFPETPHLLMEWEEKPRSLCLYDQSWQDIKLFWTGFVFLERIREWLKLTALGLLHQDDQPLEPLLVADSGTILIEDFQAGSHMNVYQMNKDYYGGVCLYATKHEFSRALAGVTLDFLFTEPRIHGIIHRTPRDLYSLQALLKAGGVELLEFLEEKLRNHKANKSVWNNRLLLVIGLPKKKSLGGPVISTDYFVVFTDDSIESLGVKLNLWEKMPGGTDLGDVFPKAINREGLKEAKISVLRPMGTFDANMAASMNGLPQNITETQFFAVGAGALGSQAIVHLIRAGLHKWIVADHDLLLPHNLARHELDGYDLMQFKVKGLARKANSIISGSVKPLIKDIILEKNDPLIQEGIAQADLVVDFSASTAALRSLAEQAGGKRMVSYFLNPAGSDFIAIVQDKEARYDIMALEVQYLRMLLHNETLHDHFLKEGKPVRYGAGCRDISFTLSQDVIANAAAIASKCTKQLLTDGAPMIRLWRTNPKDYSITHFTAQVYFPRQEKKDSWTIMYDDYVIDKVYSQRTRKLPNETGGVLIGTYDMDRKIVFVSDIIGSPEDSYEYPTAYIRGVKGLKDELSRVEQVTAGGLRYVGEWHSHPKGYGSQMSSDDHVLFGWLIDHMNKEGVPGLMLIAGDEEEFSFYIS
jgi:hypothetical protein